jgi:acylphosphatase
MSQCLHITFLMEAPKTFLHSVIQKKARALGIEGTVRVYSNGEKSITLIACGQKEAMDDFVDLLHKEAAKESIKDMEIEPFIKEKDFRGVFRIIE